MKKARLDPEVPSVQAILGVSWFQKAQSGAILFPPPPPLWLPVIHTDQGTVLEDLPKGSPSCLLCPVPGTATVNGYKPRGLNQHTGISPGSGSEKHRTKAGSGMGPPKSCMSAPSSPCCQGHWLSSTGRCVTPLSASSFSSPPSRSSSDNKVRRMRLWSQLN